MRECEHSEVTAASGEAVWALWSDVRTRPDWDAGIEWVELEGPFAAGSEGKLKPAGSRAVRFRMLFAEPGAGFADETKLPLARMRFEHQLAHRSSGGTSITHRVRISGPLAPLFTRVIGRGLARELPETVRRLARRAEGAVSREAA